MNFLKPIRVFLMAFLAYGVAGQVANAASFDCAKAQTAIEKMICSDASLSAADSELAKVFGVLKTHIADTASIVTDQRNWLKTVRNKCETVACLQEVYLARTGYLSSLNATFQPVDDTAQKCEVATPKQTKAGCILNSSVCVENANHSILQAVSSWCGKIVEDDGTQEMDVNVYLYPNKNSSAILVGKIEEKEAIPQYGSISWGNNDRNGFAELIVVDSCGIRNCAAGIHRFDSDQQIMYHYFDGTSMGDDSDISYFDGYLLNLSHGSQGSYRYDVFKVNQVGARDVVGAYSFSIGYDKGGCGFSDESINANPRNANPKPPNKKWYKFCSPKGVPGKGEGVQND